MHELKFPVKKILFFMVAKFCTTHPDCCTGKTLFANVSKIKTNWFLPLQRDISKIICNLPKWAQERAWK